MHSRGNHETCAERWTRLSSMMWWPWQAATSTRTMTSRLMSSFTNGIYDAWSTATSKIPSHVTWLCFKRWHSMKQSTSEWALWIFNIHLTKVHYGLFLM